MEILRTVIAENGRLHVALKPVWDKPDVWGLLLVDIARHLSRAFESEGSCTRDDALRRIRAGWDAELESPTDLGKTSRRLRH
ncbi:DUF5076 domain-containing protein [Peiella sedimenti]|uniref:DUF5076 domain-containing protein n=1 Tax=Peiella sedimenti TaxID=3061083 RepID=UPI003CC71095